MEEVGKRVIIAGAGNIGFRLAQSLEQTGFQVKLIERDPAAGASGLRETGGHRGVAGRRRR